jgi:DMSO/TMAO reductase YedYZ molybdopterin-dependent catalytic subunit
MRWHRILGGVLVGVLTVVPVIVIFYLVGELVGWPFFPFHVFEFVTRILPGSLVTFGIDLMASLISGLNLGSTSSTAKLAEQIMALVQFLAAGGLVGGVLAYVGNSGPFTRLPTFGLIAGTIMFLVALLAEIIVGQALTFLGSIVWPLLVLAGWGAVLGLLLHQYLFVRTEPADDDSRRRFLYLGGTALVALIASAIGLGFLFARRGSQQETAGSSAGLTTGTPAVPTPGTSGPAASPPEPTLEARIQPVPGTRAEITSRAEFYRIDINLSPPSVDAGEWRLDVSGLVDNPMSLTLDQIRQRPAVSQYITLECISNPVGGDLISGNLWTGLRLRDLLDEVGLKPEAQALYIESVDGYYETVVMEDMMDPRTLLVYDMNGQPLPEAHGYPLRIYIPNRFGMKQPKWIVRMQAVAEPKKGYWVTRGWSRSAMVRTTSVIDVADVPADPHQDVSMGGIAYASGRGISKVEVQVDDGPWQEAQLRVPPLSPLMWVQWRYEWAGEPGDHVARVRAYDGSGELQVTEENSPHPDGASGIDSYSFKV